jgi:hypothetical protein
MAVSVPVQTALSAAVADGATFTVGYPAGFVQADFTGGNASATGEVIINNNDIWREEDSKASFSYDASVVTITNDSDVTWPAGASVIVGLSHAGSSGTGPTTGAAVANLAGTLTGTVDGTIADVAAIAISTAGGNTYADTAVNTAVNTAITSLNLQLKELQTKLNALLTSLRAADVIDS